MTTVVHKRLTPPSTSYWELIKLTVPIWIANIAIVGGGTIDTLMAGHYGAVQLAGVAIGGAVTISVFVALVGVMQGLSPIAGHHFGAGHHMRIGEELHQTMWICFGLSIIGVAVLGCTPVWMAITKSTGEVAHVATLYLIFSCIGLPGSMAGRAYTALNAAVSRPKIAMVISLILLALKAPLNYIFMNGIGPFPELGGAGCGLSTAVSGWLTLGMFWAIWRFDSFYEKMRKKTFSWPNTKIILGQLRLGIPIGISSFFEVTSFTFMTVFISRLGAVTVSGHQIVANLSSLIYMLPLSVAVSGTVLVSQSLGAGSPCSARTATYRALKMGITLALTTSMLMYFFKYSVVSLYTNDPAVIAVATTLIIYASIYHVFDAINCIGAFALRGYRITLVPMVIYGVLLWGFGLGLGSTFCFTDYLTPEPLGAAGYWTSITISLIIAGIIVGGLAVYVPNQVCEGRKIRIR
ncbi:MAG: MATE family efflux transporter [Burkholderiales bacterium]|nr:MATE family efflux transporter [Burkholderiales bacterium]